MNIISLTDYGHTWSKQNLVTQFDKKGQYDVFCCTGCGITGKSRTLGKIQIDSKIKEARIFSCSANSFSVPKRIKITNCIAVGKQFANLTPNSEHDVVDPPEGEKHNWNGVWVMGVGEPVKVLSNEYIEL